MGCGVESVEVEEPSSVALNVRLQKLDSMPKVTGARKGQKQGNRKVRLVFNRFPNSSPTVLNRDNFASQGTCGCHTWVVETAAGI